MTEYKEDDAGCSLPVVSRKKAKDENKKFYFTGLPCVHGHVHMRLTSTGLCVKCMCRTLGASARKRWERLIEKERRKEYDYVRKKRKERKAYAKKKYGDDYKNKKKEYYKKNKERIRVVSKHQTAFKNAYSKLMYAYVRKFMRNYTIAMFRSIDIRKDKTLKEDDEGHLLKVVTRDQAIAAESLIYFTGRLCERGHIALRYVSRSECLKCKNAKDAKKISMNMARLAKFEEEE